MPLHVSQRPQQSPSGVLCGQCSTAAITRAVVVLPTPGGPSSMMVRGMRPRTAYPSKILVISFAPRISFIVRGRYLLESCISFFFSSYTVCPSVA